MCTRMARDQALAENARQIRKRYQRNKDLMYMIDMAKAREPTLISSRLRGQAEMRFSNPASPVPSSSSSMYYYEEETSNEDSRSK